MPCTHQGRDSHGATLLSQHWPDSRSPDLSVFPTHPLPRAPDPASHTSQGVLLARQRCRWSLPCLSGKPGLSSHSQACVPRPPGLEQQQLLLASALTRSLVPPTCTGSPGLFLGTVPSTVCTYQHKHVSAAQCSVRNCPSWENPRRLPVSSSGDFMLRAVVNHCHFQGNSPAFSCGAQFLQCLGPRTHRRAG